MTGLTSQEVKIRTENGQINHYNEHKTKTVAEIIRENVFTFFNMVNFILAFLLILVGSYRNLLFMGVVLSNMFIGIFQELKAKTTIDRLSLLTRSGVRVIRDGIEQNIPDNRLVLDDVIILSAGQQIPVDSELLDEELEVNESLLTGESRPVFKKKGDSLYSGSFVVSGRAKAVVKKVGKENYVEELTIKAKSYKRGRSEIQDSLDVLIRFISFSLIPIGILLFSKEYFLQHSTITNAVETTSGALIALIPSGLILLTSMVFALSVIKLARHKTLVQNMASAETLARIDVLCLDKTGTITEGKISLNTFYPDKKSSKEEMETALTYLSQGVTDSNETITAVRDYLGDREKLKGKLIKTVPFSSDRKYSGVEYEIDGKFVSYVFGAPNFVLKEPDKWIDELLAQGSRVLVLAKSDEPFDCQNLPKNLEALGYIAFSDAIRKEAPEIIDYLEQQGVKIKVISGDDAQTVSAIAKKAGLDTAENFIDATTLIDDEDIDENIEKYDVFGRVTPEQKQEFVKALKSHGHSVAMTGDGVNDVLALQEANTSIAMASGSEASRAVADLVLLDSNFASIPKIIAEGRQQINNLQRSSSLYLSKTIFSVLATFLFLIFPVSYPFQPIQLTLINTVTIGIPSFILAIEPNNDRVKGRFFTNIMRYAIPAGLSIFIGVFVCVLSYLLFGLDYYEMSTLCVYLYTIGGLALIIYLSIPLNVLRTAMLAVVSAIFIVAVVFFPGFFYLVSLPIIGWSVFFYVAVLEVYLYTFLNREKRAKKYAQIFTDKIFKIVRRLKRSPAQSS